MESIEVENKSVFVAFVHRRKYVKRHDGPSMIFQTIIALTISRLKVHAYEKMLFIRIDIVMRERERERQDSSSLIRGSAGRGKAPFNAFRIERFIYICIYIVVFVAMKTNCEPRTRARVCQLQQCR